MLIFASFFFLVLVILKKFCFFVGVRFVVDVSIFLCELHYMLLYHVFFCEFRGFFCLSECERNSDKVQLYNFMFTYVRSVFFFALFISCRTVFSIDRRSISEPPE